MTIDVVRSALLWGFIMNVVFIMVWFVMFALAGGWIHRVHGKWFKVSEETFHAIHYSGMAAYKMLNTLFFLVPYLALLIVG